MARSSIHVPFAACVLCGAAGPTSHHDKVVVGPVTHLLLPCFVSLRSNNVNFRVRPGRCYPIAWILHRCFLPVKIKREFKNRRQIWIPNGTEGWVSRGTIVARRRFYVKAGSLRTMHAAATTHPSPVARVQTHVIGRIVLCPAQIAWRRVEVGSVEDYLERDAFWASHSSSV